MSIQIGRFNIPIFLLALAISLFLTLLIVKFLKYDKSYRELILNLFFISFVTWKLSPILTNFNSFIKNPISTLYLPGGILGYVLAFFSSGIYILYKVKQSKLKKMLPILIYLLLSIIFTLSLPIVITSKEKNIEIPDYVLENVQNENLIVLNFWATWCPPCKAELPELNQFYENNPHIDFFGINLIETEKSKGEVMEFVNSENIIFPILFEEGEYLSSTLDIKTIPTTVVLTKGTNGYKINKHSGAITRELLEEMLKR